MKGVKAVSLAFVPRDEGGGEGEERGQNTPRHFLDETHHPRHAGWSISRGGSASSNRLTESDV